MNRSVGVIVYGNGAATDSIGGDGSMSFPVPGRLPTARVVSRVLNLLKDQVLPGGPSHTFADGS